MCRMQVASFRRRWRAWYYKEYKRQVRGNQPYAGKLGRPPKFVQKTDKPCEQ